VSSDVARISEPVRFQARPTMTPAQCRAARALLNWTQRRLADEAQVSRKTVADFETECRRVRYRTRRDMTMALQGKGVEFSWKDGEGVRLLARCLLLSIGSWLHPVGEAVLIFA
jgi:DNA-binding XRE family transcriptional regulator